MKDHLRDYFPDRFENSDISKLSAAAIFLMNSGNTRQKLKCERTVREVFEGSDELKLVAGAIKKYGCNFSLLRHVSCENCNNCHGGFDPDTKQIIICQNKMSSKGRVMSTMLHEMIHMFDYCRVNFDFDNIEHVACSEIRAANLTYCSMMDRFNHGGPGMFDFKETHQYCVKDVAFRSIKAFSPETPDEELWNVVYKVFPSCYNDLEPFGRRPTNGIKDIKQSYRERYHYGYIY